MPTPTQAFVLTPESLARIDREIAKYLPEQKQSAVIAALAIAQEEHGWLSTEAIEYVADYLDMPPVAAFEVATFYNMYDLTPVGRHKLTVCTNLPCMLSGGYHALDYLKQKLGIGVGETSADGRFTLKEGECMGACGDAPVLLVSNRRLCGSMTPEAIDALLAELD
jgi:NADH-quinone oxidoreductase subunit E